MNQRKEVLNKIIYLLKQAFPLTYNHSFSVGNARVITVWKMWLGRDYNQQVLILKKDNL